MTPAINKKSVLVLEDDPQWQQIVSHMLRKVDNEISIRCVPSTQQAIQLLAQGETFDLVVADQFLDGVMTGLDLYRHMRALRDKTSFVMLSGLASKDFNDLTESEAHTPVFVTKSNVFKTFSDVIRTEMGPAEFVGGPSEKTDKGEKGENLFLMIVTASAVAFTFSQLTLVSQAAQTASPATSYFNSVKTAPTQSAPLHAIPLKSAPTEHLASKSPSVVNAPHVFVDSALRSQLKRIMKRADDIDRRVSAK